MFIGNLENLNLKSSTIRNENFAGEKIVIIFLTVMTASSFNLSSEKKQDGVS
jgi:hypothetical protein